MNPSDNNPSTKKRGAPSWASAPFKWFLEETKQLDQLLSLSMRGISMLQAVPKIVDAVAAAEGTQDNPDHPAEMKMARETANLASNEVKEDFPLLRAYNLVAIWSLLESLIRTFVAAWLANYPEAMTIPSISKIKVRLGEYHCIPDDDKPLYIAELLETELAANLKNGVNRFEAMLEPFGLSGEVTKKTKKAIFELGQIRNVLVHCGGYADKTLIESCPWLLFEPGEKIKISKDIYSRCFHAVHDYNIQLIVRVGEKFGVDMSKFKIRRKQSHPKKAKTNSP